jgi:ectoine hydroxylase-related dioxygenase (phytanoyl-CoA dioxygenase family)
MQGVNLATHQISDTVAGVSRVQFERDGFAALEGHFTPHQVDRAAQAVRRLLAERPNEVVVDSLHNGLRTFWAQAANPQTRHFKFNDLYLMSAEVRGLAMDLGLTSVLADLLGEPAVLCNSLNFEKGSSQPKHIDSLYMTPRTPHSLIAAWIALEDVHPDAGPLVYYPGSHRIPLYTFNDGTHHATREESADWYDYIDVQIRLRGLKERAFIARKGDVFIWHSDLVHGGRPIADHHRTRSSLVCHYFGETDCVARGMDIVPMHGGYWMRRLPQPVIADPSSFGLKCPFPEETYLRRHPDVREAVEANLFPSGEHHYREYGFSEGRGV